MKNSYNYSSVFKIKSHGLVSLVVSGVLASTISYAAPATNALPTGGSISNGNVNIATSGNTMNINQASGKSIINWNTYNIGKDATVNYNFANKGSSSLNRVNDNNPSQIFGRLNANGQVILVNPNGIVFGKGSSVNVGSLVATTMNIKDADYLDGKMIFTRDNAIGKILNEGEITAEEKGYIALLAPEVVNDGVIRAKMGTISLAAGDKVELTLDDSGLKTIIVEPSAIDTLIENKALISAEGGNIYLGAKQANKLLDGVMNLKNSGTIEANSINDLIDKVTLDGDNIEVSGSITAKGGEVRAGNKDNDKTIVKGTAMLEGEFVETSGKTLKVEDGVKIKAKSWLLDPTDFTITSGSASQTVSGIGASTLANNLNAGDITIQTSGTGSESGDINVNADVTWSTNKLTLAAHGNININANLNALSNASLDMKTGYNGTSYTDTTKSVLVGKNSDGSFKGKVSFYSDAGTTARSGTGFLSINGNSYNVITNKSLFSSTIESSMSGYYALGADLASATITPVGGSSTTNANPTSFTGKFDGLGHSMTSIAFTTNAKPYYIGLFSILSSTASVSNLYLNLNTTNANMCIGGVAGQNLGKIYNVHVGGSMTGTFNTTGTLNLGGIAGDNVNGTINNASVGLTITQANTSTTPGSAIGGIAGGNSGGTISNSQVLSTTQINYNTTNKQAYIGGIVGNGGSSSSSNYNNLSSAATITVSSGSTAVSVGGVIGNLSAGTLSDITSTATLNFPNAIQMGYIGGVIGGAPSATTLNISNIKFLSPGAINANTLQTLNGGLGGLAGALKSSGTVDGGEVTGSITSNLGRVGGAIGEWDGGTIKNFKVSTTNFTVGNSAMYVGGIAGFNTNSCNMESSEFSGTMTLGNDVQHVGGLVGRGIGGYIKASKVTGVATVGTNAKYIGGLIGYGNSKLDSNDFSGTFTTGAGSTYVGSLAGWRTSAASTSEEYINNTASKTITISGASPTTDIGTATSYHGKLIGDGTLSTFTTNNIYGTLVSYTLGTGGSYTYDGTSHLLSNEWSTASIFAGTTYDNWVLGTDYVFKYNNSTVTSFTNAALYSNIVIGILKDGFAVASTGNTTGSLTIAKRALDLTVQKNYDTNANFTTGFVLGNVVDGETVTISGGSASVSSANPAAYNSFASNTLALSSQNYTLTGGTTSATIKKLNAAYSLSGASVQNNGSINTGTAITLPTLTNTNSVTPSTTPSVKVYDAQNNDVTAAALAGTLAAGSYTIKTVLTDAIYNVDNTSDTIAFSVVAAPQPSSSSGSQAQAAPASTTTQTTIVASQSTQQKPAENIVLQTADNIVKNIEQVMPTNVVSPTTIATGAATAPITPASVQVLAPTTTGVASIGGGAIVSSGGSTQLSVAMVSDANPFANSGTIDVIAGGVRLASLDLPSSPATGFQTDARPAGIIGGSSSALPIQVTAATTATIGAPVTTQSAPVTRQLAPQKGVQLAMTTSAAGDSAIVVAKVSQTKGGGFSFAVKEAVNMNIAPKDIKEVRATLDSGQALPSWLKFDAQTQTFKAINPPADALPISTKVSITTKAGQTQQIAVDITK